jgi:four helix bundle protein
MDLVVAIYRTTETFPAAERYGLTNQLRRGAVSVPSNIAEGKGRFSAKETVYFLHNARGSLYEMQTQIAIASRLGYLADDAAVNLQAAPAEVGRVLSGLIRAFMPPRTVACLDK